jgi:hypothetical protein
VPTSGEKANIAKKGKQKIGSEQANRMRNGSLFASFRFEAKKNTSETGSP